MVIDKESLEERKKAAKRDLHAAYEIGEYYYTQGDYPHSVDWYKKAIEGYNPEPLALFALGYAYQTGQGVPVDLIQALHYYEAAASYNVPQAFYNLAYFYQNGLGVKRDQERADHYVLRASECLKSLSEELFAAKNAQKIIQDRYDDAIRSVALKSDEWLCVSKECEQQKEQQTLLQSRIDALKEKTAEYDSRLTQCSEELEKKNVAHELLLQTHQQVLNLVDEQKRSLAKAYREKEEANTCANRQKSQCEVLTERISQKDREIEDILRLQTESQDRQLALQKQLDESLERINAYEAERKSNEARLAELNLVVNKVKRSRAVFFLLGVLTTLGVSILIALTL